MDETPHISFPAGFLFPSHTTRIALHVPLALGDIAEKLSVHPPCPCTTTIPLLSFDLLVLPAILTFETFPANWMCYQLLLHRRNICIPAIPRIARAVRACLFQDQSQNRAILPLVRCCFRSGQRRRLPCLCMGGPETAAAVSARHRHRAGPRRLMITAKRMVQVEDFSSVVEGCSKIVSGRAHVDLRTWRMMTRIVQTEERIASFSKQHSLLSEHGVTGLAARVCISLLYIKPSW